MVINFKNGSTIETIQSMESVRGKHANIPPYMEPWELACLDEEGWNEIIQPFITNRGDIESNENLPDQIVYLSSAHGVRKIMDKINLIGYLVQDDYEYFFYKNENGEICKDDGTLYDDEILKMFAIGVNSPWSNTYDNYYIEHIVPDVKLYHGPFWKCLREVIGYDGITAHVYGYGNEPNEALKRCTEMEKYLQQVYNPERKRV